MKSGLKIALGVWFAGVITATLVFPIVESPQEWYEFPVIPGLEHKARIMFFHVPMAWVTAIAFLVSVGYAVRFLSSKNPEEDQKAAISAGLGLLFCVLATVTGAIWARFNWGAFWNWDPRQTSIFALLLIYGAYFALRSALEGNEKKASLSSVYAILAGVTVPFFIFVMPRILPGLHPGSKESGDQGPLMGGTINPVMRIVFYASLLGFTVLYLWMFSLRIRFRRIELSRGSSGK